ncbi:hypothetical protein b3_0200 [Synechococcus phage B3]|nr:hypothetical protein b3_0200 [Synechococcus phage B3]QGT54813.1 hypothetical protein b23_0198 [Synechococcus phage B23]
MITLKPHYSGKFEAFRCADGTQYARLEFPSGSYVWFRFDYTTETYQSFDNELFEPSGVKTLLQKCLEKSYRDSKTEV